ncbi:MAG: hypothetical protein ACLFVJ_13080 [Persicimonas sp.]
MNCKRLIASSIVTLSALAIGPISAFAQGNYEAADDQQQHKQQPAKPQERAEQPQPTEATGETISVSVSVVHATGEDEPLADKPVILRAARVKGPFEPNYPDPVHEWTGLSDASGQATFDDVPASIVDEGLRLHAVTTHGGRSFNSPQTTPREGAQLSVPVYELGADTSGVAIENLQTVVHVWEDQLFFQQMWMLTLDDDRVLDTSMLEGEAFENGLPLDLPVKAKGINVNAAQDTEVIDSTVFWRGTLEPGQVVPVTVQYSMTADVSSFVYEQTLDYPAKNVEVVVPVEPQNERLQISYFEDVALAAPGFEVEQRSGAQGMAAQRSQNTGIHLTAERSEVQAGEAFQFKLTGLPFKQPMGAWISLGLGLLGALFVFGFARNERKRMSDSQDSGELLEILVEEREDLLDELALLEEDYLDGEVGEIEYERERLLLRERIALVMKKLRTLKQDQAA